MGGKGSGGRNRKPTAQKKAEGNRGKRKLNENEPTPEFGDPIMPPKLTAAEREAWLWLLPIIKDNGVVTSVDGIALAAMCSSYVLYCRANAAVEKYGNVIAEVEELTGVATVKMNPSVRVRAIALKEFRTSWQSFGLDPSSRAGLQKPKKPEGESALDKILRSKSAKDDIVN